MFAQLLKLLANALTSKDNTKIKTLSDEVQRVLRQNQTDDITKELIGKYDKTFDATKADETVDINLLIEPITLSSDATAKSKKSTGKTAAAKEEKTDSEQKLTLLHLLVIYYFALTATDTRRFSLIGASPADAAATIFNLIKSVITKGDSLITKTEDQTKSLFLSTVVPAHLSKTQPLELIQLLSSAGASNEWLSIEFLQECINKNVMIFIVKLYDKKLVGNPTDKQIVYTLIKILGKNSDTNPKNLSFLKDKIKSLPVQEDGIGEDTILHITAGLSGASQLISYLFTTNHAKPLTLQPDATLQVPAKHAELLTLHPGATLQVPAEIALSNLDVANLEALLTPDFSKEESEALSNKLFRKMLAIFPAKWGTDEQKSCEEIYAVVNKKLPLNLMGPNAVRVVDWVTDNAFARHVLNTNYRAIRGNDSIIAHMEKDLTKAFSHLDNLILLVQIYNDRGIKIKIPVELKITREKVWEFMAKYLLPNFKNNQLPEIYLNVFKVLLHRIDGEFKNFEDQLTKLNPNFLAEESRDFMNTCGANSDFMKYIGNFVKQEKKPIYTERLKAYAARLQAGSEALLDVLRKDAKANTDDTTKIAALDGDSLPGSVPTSPAGDLGSPTATSPDAKGSSEDGNDSGVQALLAAARAKRLAVTSSTATEEIETVGADSTQLSVPLTLPGQAPGR